ncbi:sulfite exporter TauE/SafE family protein [Pontibacter brevis]
MYLLGLPPVISTAYSLFIVGLTSLVGSYKFYQRGLVSFKTAFVFGLPSIVSVYATRRYIVPAIPENIFTIGGFEVTKNILLMLLFAGLMVVASISMIRQSNRSNSNSSTNTTPGLPGNTNKQVKPAFNYGGILAEGAVVGTITGLVGAGGGFLIIPALVLFSKLDMKLAVGTSLLIIASKSLVGFAGDIYNYQIDWGFLSVFSALSIAGIFLGTFLSTKIQPDKLRKAFGWFVLVMGMYIIGKELFF